MLQCRTLWTRETFLECRDFVNVDQCSSRFVLLLEHGTSHGGAFEDCLDELVLLKWFREVFLPVLDYVTNCDVHMQILTSI